MPMLIPVRRPLCRALAFFAVGVVAQAHAVDIRVSTSNGPVTDSAGVQWEAASGFVGGHQWGGSGVDIAGTHDDVLYRPEWAAMRGWSRAVPNGRYQVTLKMRESWFNRPNARRFSVSAEGLPQVTNLDLYQTVGRHTAYDASFLVQVNDGRLDLGFSAEIDDPQISAIRVVSAPQAAGAIRVSTARAPVTDSKGRVWEAASGFHGGWHWGGNNSNIAGTDDDALYSAEWAGMSGWARPVPNGTYTVTVKMRESWAGMAGTRIFSIGAEDKWILNDIDIFAAVGRHAAYDRSFPVSVTDGVLNIGFSSRPGSVAQVSAIEVVPGNARPPGVSLRPVDGGGPAYYGTFTNGLPSGNDFFPIGVWAAGIYGQGDVNADKGLGLNTYVHLTDASDFRLARASGMYILGSSETLQEKNVVDVSSGWTFHDEVDMWAGPGNGSWSGNVSWGAGGAVSPDCTDGTPCGFTVQNTTAAAMPKDGRMTWVNYGKGVLFWAGEADAATFVNRWGSVLSSDAYWYTDGDICGQWQGGKMLNPGAPRALSESECRLSKNYGAQVKRMRSLVKPEGSKPVWAFVELGQPSEHPARPAITPAQMRGAVWSSLINGARGITYFNHSFGGPCPTVNILRHGCYVEMRNAVIALNKQIAGLAPVLNAPDVLGMVQATGVETLTKAHQGDLYIFAHPLQMGRTQMTARLAATLNGSAEVVGEGRSVPVTNGVLTDVFNDDMTTHIYRIRGGAAASGL